jgi:hypothetical protein
MKFHGKAISGTSLLTILGVLCFATVIVAAVSITSNTLTFANTSVSNPGTVTLTQTSTPGTIVLGNPAVYGFNANVQNHLTGVVVTVDIAKTGISTSDVTNATIRYDSGLTTNITFSAGATNHIIATYNVADQVADATIPCTVTITYAATGTYAVSVTLAGTA